MNYELSLVSYEFSVIVLVSLTVVFPVILSNMLIGLAVDDISDFRHDMEIEKSIVKFQESLNTLYRIPNKYRTEALISKQITFILNKVTKSMKQKFVDLINDEKGISKSHVS